MKKRDLLPVIKARKSPWDSELSQRARDHLNGELLATQTRGRPVDTNSIQLPCIELADMSRACLVEFTGYSEEDFETVSDCLHMSSMVEATTAPQYVKGLLDVLATCLFIQDHIEDGNPELAAAEIPELIRLLEALEPVGESIYWLKESQAMKPLAQSALVTYQQRTQAGFSSGQQRAEERKATWAAWQARASEIFSRNQQLSKSEICKRVAEEFSVTREAVAKRVAGVGKPRREK